MKTIATIWLWLPLLLWSSTALAQSDFWRALPQQQLSVDEERRIIPNKFEAYSADTTALRDFLWAAPHERDVSPPQSEHIISIPDPNGEMQSFQIVAYDLFEAALQEKWWYIGTWRGVSTTNPMTTIRLDWTIRGFHAMVRSEGGNWFVDPFYWNRNDVYQVYYKADYPAPPRPFECHTIDDRKSGFDEGTPQRAGDCRLRGYRLALACTGEYATFHGGTVPLVASAFTTSMNRVNGVYEEDLALRLTLVGNNNNLIYLNSGTDPYTNNSGSTMLGENQSNCDAVIGTANYDIGHVFSTGGGGVASLRSPCVSTRKARGVTGQGSPIGDPFDIDYVAHEMGHQFGGNHTQNNSCNRSSASMEPGSASTIMGYAGICSPNVQSNSDDYYHGVNIQEIANYMESGGGSTCSSSIDSSNGEPTIPTAGDDYDIPGGTPFVLTGNATDPDGDPLTYCWEQYDNEVGESMPPLATNTQGPMFRSFDPASSPQRYFPRLTDIVNNVDPTWETLPETNRDMDFRVTVRDFDGTYGCTTEDEITLSVDASAGPFLVTSPNTNVTWFEGSQATVTWDVAGTTAAPISCSNVDILLSTDGGFNYTALSSGTPNDGSQTVTVPGGTSTTARVMVRCSDNVFFDISNVNFTIDAAAMPDYTFSYGGGTESACEGSNGSFVFLVNSASIGGYSDPLTLSATSTPLGVSVAFSANPINPGTDVLVTVSNFGSLSAGNYTVTVQSSSTGGNKTVDLPFTLTNAPAAPSLAAPANMATDVDLFPVFDWNSVAIATSYTLEVADDVNFNNVILTENTGNTEFTMTSPLNGETTYYWRVTSGNAECGNVNTSSVRSFDTQACYYYSSTGTVAISSGAPADYTSDINIPHSGDIDDIDLVNLDITHTWAGDLQVQLESPAGTIRTMFSYECGNVDDVLLTFDDEASNALSCPLNTGDKVQPSQTLDGFDNETMAGNWVLRLRDNANQDGGQLNGWNLKVCTSNFSILPVEWLSFAAQEKDRTVELQWQTTAEENNLGFDIERRADYETDFQAIGWVDATVAARNINDYYFLDQQVKSGVTYYYRLRQLDYSGSYSYSEIKSVKISGEEPQWQLYPNPAKDQLHLRLWNIATSAEITVFNSQGQLVFRQGELEAGEQFLDLSTWHNGIYWIQLKAGPTVRTERVLKL